MNSSNPETPAGAGSSKRKHFVRWGIISLLLLILLLVLWPNRTHAHSESIKAEPVVVAAAKVRREEIAQELVFDSELVPYQEVEVHAKVAGYVQNILVDVGDHVAEGQLIATLELPEVEHDLERATASQKRSLEEIKRAKAAYEEAHLNFTRLTAIEKAQPRLIAQQDLDNAESQDKTAEATLAATKEQANVAIAEVKRYKTMLQYAQITAPFKGVITKRYADKGALIQAGTTSSTQAMPLVRLSENEKLRLRFPVSASYVSFIKSGEPVEVELPSLKRQFAAKISRFAQKVDTATRTMETEVEVKNPDFSLVPGMYATVRLKVNRKPNAIILPTQAVSRRGGNTVYLIDGNGIIEEKKITLGMETSSELEVLSGLSENDLVMIGSRSQVKPGQQVTPKVMEIASTENH